MKHKRFSGPFRDGVTPARLLAICLFSLTTQAFASEELTLSLRETVRQADTIVLGTVTAKQSRWGDTSRRWIVTDYSFSVERVIYQSERKEAINHAMMLTIPFVLYGIFRYLYLIHIKGEGGAPDELVLTDRPLQITFALWGLSAVAVLYLSRFG